MKRLKTVLHAHTDYSHDSNRSPEELVATAVQQGVECVGITDHNEIRGALAARELGRVRVIVGAEILTTDGDLIGLFLEERIPPGLSAVETARRIRAQGGLVLAPHAFASLCADRLGSAMDELVPWLDAVEVCNSQNPLWWEDRRAAAFAVRHGLTGYVGADAHLRGYLAGGYQWVPKFDGAESFRQALRRAELVPRRFGPTYMAGMALQHYWYLLFRQRLPGFAANMPGQAPVPAD